MPAKMTSKYQLTLPQAITDELGSPEYFDAESRNGKLILTPVRIQRADAVRSKLAEPDLAGTAVQDAADWARPNAGK